MRETDSEWEAAAQHRGSAQRSVTTEKSGTEAGWGAGSRPSCGNKLRQSLTSCFPSFISKNDNLCYLPQYDLHYYSVVFMSLCLRGWSLGAEVILLKFKS